jgi:hypothetical protein
MTDVLERAKAKQNQTASTTDVWLKLDLLEGLIAEIEQLRHRVDALSQDHTGPGGGPGRVSVVELRKRAEKREEESKDA